jgi:hypothetical protein
MKKVGMIIKNTTPQKALAGVINLRKMTYRITGTNEYNTGKTHLNTFSKPTRCPRAGAMMFKAIELL